MNAKTIEGVIYVAAILLVMVWAMRPRVGAPR